MLIPIEELKELLFTKIKGVFHCGAHSCEEKPLYQKLGINRIVWFEANKEKVEEQRAKFNVVHNICISDIDNQEVEFHITNNYQSSSVLPLKLHKKIYSNIKEIESRKMMTTRLDTFINEFNINMNNFNFINLDLQGYELKALKSLGKYIKHFDYVYVEVNFIELYEGIPLIKEVEKWLEGKGFARVFIHDTNCGWGDAFYIRIK